MECCSCEALITSISVIIAIVTYWETNKIDRRRDSIEYLSKVRDEIWELIAEEDVESISNLNELNKRKVRQKLEYIAFAVNSGYVKLPVLKKLCGSWYASVAKFSGAIDHVAYEETKKLYKELEN